ncbi:recombinase [Lactococcus hodotermopsidis]|uniref:Recombinase n=1 Tax=Pseudolactococcus hodotermopsidis TaxID=2709157 RepID=A0A6A0BFB8_9LACT|nr:recombinase family protein [Lactococcus hodotermopsidis]GFH43038.1 recombinase [Lactococcus hodotermopsidis]
MHNSTLKIKEYTEVDLEQLQDITVVYCRLSQDDGNAGDSDSITNQKQYLGDFAINENLQNPIYFVDDGYSGTSFNRPAIQKALALVESGKVRNFLVKDLSRLGRDYLRVGQLLELTFPTHQIRFIALNDNVDSTKSDEASDNLLPLRNLFNEWYARDTSKKIKAVKHAKAKAGEKICAFPPYGYLKSPDNPKNWIIDEEASQVVKLIFQLAKEGLGVYKIAKYLRTQKIETPIWHKVNRGIAINHQAKNDDPYAWVHTTIASMLSKEEYLGHTVSLKTYKISYKSRQTKTKPKDEWLIFKDAHPAIIDQETFDIVQQMRKHKRVQKHHYDEIEHANLFAGLIFCGACDSKEYFCAKQKGETNLDHYKCSRYANVRRNCENPHYIRKNALETIVLEDLKKLCQGLQKHESEFVDKLKVKFELESNHEVAKLKRKIRASQKRHVEIDSIIQRLYEDTLTQKLSDERFRKLTTNYEIEQDKLKNELVDMKKELAKHDEQNTSIQQFIKIVKKYTEMTELTTEIVNSLISKIVIHRPENIPRSKITIVEIHYNFVGELDLDELLGK